MTKKSAYIAVLRAFLRNNGFDLSIKDRLRSSDLFEELLYLRFREENGSIKKLLNDNFFLKLRIKEAPIVSYMSSLEVYLPTKEEMDKSWLDVRYLAHEDDSFSELVDHVNSNAKRILINECLNDFFKKLDLYIEDILVDAKNPYLSKIKSLKQNEIRDNQIVIELVFRAYRDVIDSLMNKHRFKPKAVNVKRLEDTTDMKKSSKIKQKNTISQNKVFSLLDKIING